MHITHLGHSCFRVETKSGSTGALQADSGSVSLLIDPFSKDIGLRPPRIKDNLVLVTHDHNDHNNLDGVDSDCFVVNSPGEYERHGLYVRGINSYHDNKEGKDRGLNTIYVIKIEDMTVCHLGDLGQDKLDDAQVEDIGNVDILMIPVGGNYTIDYKTAVKVVSQVEPKVVIPMHYKVKGLKLDIDGLEKFIKELEITPEKVDRFKIVKKNLPVDKTQLIVFN
jgi:L-ascorbate metabolism protein UlaG (beta-lactamase superfamily)